MELTLSDYANLHNLLRRATYTGLDEAAAAVVLAQKLEAKMRELQKATRPAEA